MSFELSKVISKFESFTLFVNIAMITAPEIDFIIHIKDEYIAFVNAVSFLFDLKNSWVSVSLDLKKSWFEIFWLGNISESTLNATWLVLNTTVFLKIRHEEIAFIHLLFQVMV